VTLTGPPTAWPVASAHVAPTAAFVSFRLGHPDGVSVEAGKWAAAFAALGWQVTSVAGAGPVDHLVPGLALDADDTPPTPDELDKAFADADLVVVENMCSLPLNRRAAEAVAKALRDRPALLHHHDLPWQQDKYRDETGFPPNDARWAHVTVNHLSRHQLAERGIRATTIPNCFDPHAPRGVRDRARTAIQVAADERLLVQPTRAIPRKNVPGAIRLAEALGATYWLVGAAEDGYEDELGRHLRQARTRVVRGLPDGVTMADAYAAADAVALPSTWEGFGNPTVESAVHRRPLAVGRYPVAREIAAYGFRWFPADDSEPLAAWLASPDPAVLDGNEAIARRHFSLECLERRLGRVLADAGWPGPAP
jgi:glycosyltransferase involved in cell wall biosynthesis